MSRQSNPQTLFQTHWMEIIHPFAFPVFIFQRLILWANPAPVMLLQNRDNVPFGVGFGVEQTDHIGIAPQTASPGNAQNRRIVYPERYRNAPASISASPALQHSRRWHSFTFDPWHGKTYLSVDNNAGLRSGRAESVRSESHNQQ